MTLDELFGLGKPQYITLTFNRKDIERLRLTIQEYQKALNSIPVQDTTLHLKWSELKRIIELFLLHTE